MMQKRHFLAGAGGQEPVQDTSATTAPAAFPLLRARFRDRRHPVLATAACAIAVLIGLAVVPVVFVTADRALVVEWSNAFFDLAGL